MGSTESLKLGNNRSYLCFNEMILGERTSGRLQIRAREAGAPEPAEGARQLEVAAEVRRRGRVQDVCLNPG